MRFLQPATTSLTSLLSISGPTVQSLLQRKLRPATLQNASLAARPNAQARGFQSQQSGLPPAPEGSDSQPRARNPRPSRGVSRGGGRGGGRSGEGSVRSGSRSGGGGALRLNKALASVGVASRRGADEMVFAGRVSINGKVTKEPGTQVALGRDKLAVDGRPVSTAGASAKYYFALNKPKGYICSSKAAGGGGSGDRLVVDLFGEWLEGWKQRHPGASALPRLFTVGRLDVASIGLVLVTNDGDWAQSVQHPSSGLTREYSVTLDQRPGRAQLEAMASGCVVDGVRVTPVDVALDDSDRSKTNRIRVVLAEGRNREVRRVVEGAGMEIKVLRRVRVGGYRLPRSLAFGQFVELRPHEVRRVLNVGADRTV